MSKEPLYRVIFTNRDKVYELYARFVSQESMYGFVEIEGIVFGEKSAVVVDPAEEKLKAEFAGVERTWVPMHEVIRIDQVAAKGQSKISPAGESNVTTFPLYTPDIKGPQT